MNTPFEEASIVRTVIKGFFIQPDDTRCIDKLTDAVLNVVKGRTNNATARYDLRRALAEIQHEADDDRLDLCIETAQALASGYNRWLQDQTDMDEYPAWELHPVFQRKEIVDWSQKWRENGGGNYPRGQMIALKNDPIWARISAFHLPFPPFELDSGMRFDGIPRIEAEELGLLARLERIEPGSVNHDFEKELRARVRSWFSKCDDEPE